VRGEIGRQDGIQKATLYRAFVPRALPSSAVAGVNLALRTINLHGTASSIATPLDVSTEQFLARPSVVMSKVTMTLPCTSFRRARTG
jgi:hypothetical protein